MLGDGREDLQLPRACWAAVIVAAVWFPSIGTAATIGGAAGPVVHLALCAAAVTMGDRWLTRRATAMGDRTALTILVAIALVVVVAFVALHPRADRTAAGRGSDRDEAIDLAVEAVRDGRYPYGDVTYLNGPITSMPSLLLLSSPWVVAVGTSALQNVAWALAGLGVLVAWFGDRRRAAIAAGLVAALCLGFWREHVTGGDLTSSTIVVTMAVLWSRARLQRELTWPALVAVGVVLGLAISIRANLVLLLAPVLAVAWSVHGPRTAKVLGGVAVATAAAITLPLYLADPSGFTPLTAVTKVSGIEDVVPGARFLIPGIGAALAAVLALRVAWRGPLGFLAACAAPQLAMVAPVVAVLALAGRPSSYYAIYGLAFTWFAVLAGVTALYGTAAPRSPAYVPAHGRGATDTPFGGRDAGGSGSARTSAPETREPRKAGGLAG